MDSDHKEYFSRHKDRGNALTSDLEVCEVLYVLAERLCGSLSTCLVVVQNLPERRLLPGPEPACQGAPQQQEHLGSAHFGCPAFFGAAQVSLETTLGWSPGLRLAMKNVGGLEHATQPPRYSSHSCSDQSLTMLLPHALFPAACALGPLGDAFAASKIILHAAVHPPPDVDVVQLPWLPQLPPGAPQGQEPAEETRPGAPAEEPPGTRIT